MSMLEGLRIEVRDGMAYIEVLDPAVEDELLDRLAAVGGLQSVQVETSQD